jgi:hypothetical protein
MTRSTGLAPMMTVHPSERSQAGFRVRKASLILGDSDKDFQAALAYQGSMAYVYLADRTT